MSRNWRTKSEGKVHALSSTQWIKVNKKLEMTSRVDVTLYAGSAMHQDGKATNSSTGSLQSYHR
jgi:hypothetical protein